MKKAIVAMSGGVDSSVAAALMLDDGYSVTGVTLKMFDAGTGDEDAAAVAANLGIEHITLDASKVFKEKVIDSFVNSYCRCETPNPCVQCNRFVKFAVLTGETQDIDCDILASGHYARVEYDSGSGRYLLKKAADPSKDQSYVLYSLSQSQLAKTRFPLGGLTKAQVREIAQERGFVNAHKSDSQDICFIPDGDYAHFIEKYTGRAFPAGNFVDKDGNILGQHKGLIHYTIGQRRGLGLALPHPMYVSRLDPAENSVILCENDQLFSRSLTAKNFNLIALPRIDGELRVTAKIRYAHKEQPAVAVQTGENTVAVTFDSPQRAITPGQSVVLYDGDTVIGGGIIE